MAKINSFQKAVVLNQNHVLAALIAFFLLIYALVPPVEPVQPAEIERPPIVTVAPPLDLSEARCLARVIYGEARGDVAGQRAVAWAAINRTMDGRWPSTVCLVAVQKGQFSLAPQTVERDAWQASLDVARQVMIDRHNREPDPTNGAVFFAHVKPGQTLPWTHGKGGLKISHHTFWK